MSQPRPPIAVVGLSALFPGSTDETGFWKDILAGNDLLKDVPAGHWLIEDYYDPDPSAPDKTYAKRGGFLPKVPFDALSWGVPPSIVPATDTAQLLALIVAQRVLDDAARGRDMDRSRMSVILGVTSAQELLGTMVSRLQRPVWQNALRQVGLPEDQVQAACARIAAHYTPWQESTFPGLLGNVVAGRIANRLDLGGTNCVTDAACASAFSALHMAVNELYLGDSDAVVCGGVDTMNDIFMYMCFSKTPALSRSGDVRPFSDQADGTMLGEGLGMFLLKRLEDAERDGDPIYAVLRGVGSSSDGRSKSVYAPVSEGQAKALRRTYEHAGYSPATVELVEAHGTGTRAGDAAEFGGLKAVFDESGRHDRQWCALGSVKSQVGHTKAAAGAAGLFKAIMAVQHAVLPPTIKVERPDPKLKIAETPFYLNTVARPWIRDGAHPRRASVSSFGFGGSNFHVAVEEYKGAGRHAERLDTFAHHLVALSAPDAAHLVAEARALAERAQNQPGTLRFAAHSSQRSFQGGAPVRLTVVAESDADLAKKLLKAAEAIEAQPAKPTLKLDGVAFGAGAPEGGLGFLFPGQGSQYVGMGGALAMAFPTATEAWDHAARLGIPLHTVNFPVPVFDEAEAEAQQTRLTATENAQPAIGAASLATFRLLQHLGLRPDAVAGHSFGEVTALHAAGALSEGDFLQAAATRGAAMAAAAASTSGAMTAAAGKIETVREIISKAGIPVVVANHNHPTQVVLSGATEAIAQAEAALSTAGVASARLGVSTAFHSHIVAGATTQFGADLQSLSFTAPNLPVFADATAAAYPTDPAAVRAQLAGQLAEPVRFVELIETMHAAGVRTFVEVGPNAVLTGLVGRILKGKAHTALQTDKRKKDGVLSFLETLGKLAAEGRPVDLSRLLADYRVPADPRTVARPKMVVEIDGSNVDKPYPPKAGPTGKAPPVTTPRQLETKVEPKPETKAPSEVAAKVEAKAQPQLAPANPSPAPRTALPAATPPAPAQTLPPTPISPVRPSAAPAAPSTPAAAVSAQVRMSSPNQPSMPVAGWLQAWQETQRQTAEAHSTFQRTMAEAHGAFLRTAETSFVGLASLLSGQPLAAAQVAAPTFAAPTFAAPTMFAATAAQPVTQATVAPAPLPQVAAPAAAVAPAPAPVVAAPVAAPAAPAQSPKAPAAAAAPAATAGVDKLMLQVVAEKTGYPVEMLGLDMDLEGDLGVDSIKRVEILSAVQERAPHLPKPDAAALGQLRTLGQIVTALGGAAASPAAAPPVAAAPTPPPAAATPNAGGPAVDQLMLQVVAEKTGYPVEMLGLDMDLEGDLGVDSIKRVEILSAVQERAPHLPKPDAAALGQLRTLGQIVTALGGATAASPAAPAPVAAPIAAPAVAAPAPTAGDLAVDKLMLQVVAEKTGYPVEMLGLDMDLEGDLGVDSIKRVEILSAVQERAPHLPKPDAAALGQLRTLGQIVTALGGATAPRSAAAAPPPVTAMPDGIGRWAALPVEAPASGLVRRGLLGSSRPILVFSDHPDASTFVEVLRLRGLPAEQCPDVAGIAAAAEVGTLLVLGPYLRAEETDRAETHLLDAFRATRALFRRTDGPHGLITVQDTGGSFGHPTEGTPLSSAAAWTGSLAGLARTAIQERPTLTTKIVDLSRHDRHGNRLPLSTQAALLADELLLGGPEVEVGIRADGPRITLVDRLLPTHPAQPVLGRGDVVVVSGGARGVTAACVVTLGQHTGARFVLLGRTPLQTESPEFAAIQGEGAALEAALKKACVLAATARGERPAPAAIGRQVANILAAREIRATLSALLQVGSEGIYEAVDVLDVRAVDQLLERIRKTWGPIRGVIHGAGIIQDRLIEEKTDEQFQAVVHTKVAGLRSLLAATHRDPLSTILLFSSVAARAGNRGQVDYAMANEFLNLTAWAEAAHRPGCIVRALGWGPWEGGMVTPALKARFQALGVPLIPLDVGAHLMWEEICEAKGPAAVVLGGRPIPEPLLTENAPPAPPVVLSLSVDPQGTPGLLDHQVDGQVVVPMVQVVDWMVRAAESLHPAHTPESGCWWVEQVSVLKGLVLEGPARLEIEVREDQHASPGSLHLRLLDLVGRPRYKAVLRRDRTPTKSDLRPLTGGESRSGSAIYDGKVLFHGPAWRALRQIDHLSDQGLDAQVLGATRLGWSAHGHDLPALDAVLQAALVWTHARLAGPSLPTGIDRICVHNPGPATGELRMHLRGRQAEGGHATSDAVLVDGSGNTFAVFEGIHTHLLPRRA